MPVNVVNAQDLSHLRAELKHPTKEGIHKVAQQFESVFVGMMLKSMRQATPDDPLFGGAGVEQYRGLYDQQLAMSMSKRGGFGIAQMVERQLSRNAGLDDGSSAKKLDGDVSSYRANALERARVTAPLSTRPATDSAPAEGQGAKKAQWQSPAEFVKDLWPAAQRAAQRIGADPKAIVAQAALETGWGRHVMTDANGKSSFNLFGIKAGSNWKGETVSAPTLEYRDGVAGKETARFRAYDSVDACMQDYADFLHSHPRYRQALSAGDVASFSKALQQAGYATDPRYAEKIQHVAAQSVVRNAGAEGTENG